MELMKKYRFERLKNEDYAQHISSPSPVTPTYMRVPKAMARLTPSALSNRGRWRHKIY
jgi:hypothetical protein